jgi:type II secretory ATPase GspE/PulE/Tfp pilus assembly ATPase PilB-like protein
MTNDLAAAILRGTRTLTPQQLESSVREARARKIPLWDLIVLERQVPEEALADALSTSLKIPRVRLDAIEIEAAAINIVSARLARRHACLPIRLIGKHLVLAMSNPLDQQAIQDVQFASNRQVQAVVASRAEILIQIETHYSPAAPRSGDRDVAEFSAFASAAPERDEMDLERADAAESAENAPAVHLCRQIVFEAVRCQASDIHIEPGLHEFRVRLRVDGVLRDHLLLPHWMHAPLVSRIKILARLDISQQRLPQDGRIRIKGRNRGIDLRVSTLPTQFGEKVVLRLLGSSEAPMLAGLGLSAAERTVIEDALIQPQGLILVTGPTGAGKTTTLYSMLCRRQSPEVNIVTIEDPIEYELPGATQVQVDSKTGLTFASCLRAILRQDPDVLLVGEIRDRETAEIAFEAALTGHIVFSTVHANSSLAAIDRLLDLGVTGPLLSAATNLIIAQRLARRICEQCREPYTPSSDVLRRLPIDPHRQQFEHGRGCSRCGQTGYSGRVGIFEILPVNARLKESLNRGATETELRRAATATGMRFLLEDALDKVRQGLTTIEEVLRVIRVDANDDRPISWLPALAGRLNRFDDASA